MKPDLFKIVTIVLFGILIFQNHLLKKEISQEKEVVPVYSSIQPEVEVIEVPIEVEKVNWVTKIKWVEKEIPVTYSSNSYSPKTEPFLIEEEYTPQGIRVNKHEPEYAVESYKPLQ